MFLAHIPKSTIFYLFYHNENAVYGVGFGGGIARLGKTCGTINAAVMILSLFLEPGAAVGGATEAVTSMTVMQEIGHAIVEYIGDVALILLPIIVLFVLFQIFAF